MAIAPRQTRTLSSWKEIAAYLGKGVRTVQRWERELGLPVRRPDLKNRGVVVATQAELDRWLRIKWSQRSITQTNGTGNGKVSDAIRSSRDLHAANREIVDDLLRTMQELRTECETLARTAANIRPTRRGGRSRI